MNLALNRYSQQRDIDIWEFYVATNPSHLVILFHRSVTQGTVRITTSASAMKPWEWLCVTCWREKFFVLKLCCEILIFIFFIFLYHLHSIFVFYLLTKCIKRVNVFIFRSVMEKSFLEYYDFYEGVCKERLHLQGQNMQVSIYFLSDSAFSIKSFLMSIMQYHMTLWQHCVSQESKDYKWQSFPLSNMMLPFSRTHLGRSVAVSTTRACWLVSAQPTDDCERKTWQRITIMTTTRTQTPAPQGQTLTVRAAHSPDFLDSARLIAEN